MGNVKDDAEFFEHFDSPDCRTAQGHAVGLECLFHCMDMPSSRERDGVIGLKDFPATCCAPFNGTGSSSTPASLSGKTPDSHAAHEGFGLLHKSVRGERGYVSDGHP